jgi:5-methyltetrahydropteroyltriglutamate--homocysteine methyltransferase
VYAHLLDADIDAVGVDLLHGRDDTLYNLNEYGVTDEVALGLVDGQNTRIESTETVADRIEWAQEQVVATTFDRVYATPTTELFYLPVASYRAKLAALADGVAVARGDEPREDRSWTAADGDDDADADADGDADEGVTA